MRIIMTPDQAQQIATHKSWIAYLEPLVKFNSEPEHITSLENIKRGLEELIELTEDNKVSTGNKQLELL
jgi:hypothetical protein